jgi:hypothetical protein
MTGARRGRPRKAVETTTEQGGTLTVKVAGAVFDGQGGFHPVGHKISPNEETAASLIAKGLAE